MTRWTCDEMPPLQATAGRGGGMNRGLAGRTVLSLFDYTGIWSAPYLAAGANVIQIDLKHGIDVMDLCGRWLMRNVMDHFGKVDGILAAPPCTDFAVSGAQYWKAKDADGRTARSTEVVLQVLRIVDFCKPDWWALENPVGRLANLLPQLGKPWYFQPWWYGDPWTKKTGLFGYFNRALPRNEVTPRRVCSQGSWVQQLGGKSERTKEKRSATPPGFARAFFLANSWSVVPPGGTTPFTLSPDGRSRA